MPGIVLRPLLNHPLLSCKWPVNFIFVNVYFWPRESLATEQHYPCRQIYSVLVLLSDNKSS